MRNRIEPLVLLQYDHVTHKRLSDFEVEHKEMIFSIYRKCFCPEKSMETTIVALYNRYNTALYAKTSLNHQLCIRN